MLLDWGKKGLEGKLAQLISLVRRRRLEHIPADVLRARSTAS